MKKINAENYNNNLLTNILANIKDAAELTKNYYDQLPINLNFIEGEYFGEALLQLLLNQARCFVIVGVFGDGNDLTTGENMVFDFLCPAECSTNNYLNS